jgi:hypothetical protein
MKGITMTLKLVFASSLLVMSSSFAFASDEGSAIEQQNVTNEAEANTQVAPNYYHGGYGRSYICQAESTHGGQHYYGDYSLNLHQAQHSALDECQYHEGHACVLVGCGVR